MQSKLTLSIDKSVVQRAKNYARKRNKSLSGIIEDYLKTVSGPETGRNSLLDSIPEITGSLAGILKGKEEVDFRSEITDYLEKKYK